MPSCCLTEKKLGSIFQRITLKQKAHLRNISDLFMFDVFWSPVSRDAEAIVLRA